MSLIVHLLMDTLQPKMEDTIYDEPLFCSNVKGVLNIAEVNNIRL